jgi:hypothetical protein
MTLAESVGQRQPVRSVSKVACIPATVDFHGTGTKAHLVSDDDPSEVEARWQCLEQSIVVNLPIVRDQSTNLKSASPYSKSTQRAVSPDESLGMLSPPTPTISLQSDRALFTISGSA